MFKFEGPVAGWRAGQRRKGAARRQGKMLMAVMLLWLGSVQASPFPLPPVTTPCTADLCVRACSACRPGQGRAERGFFSRHVKRSLFQRIIRNKRARLDAARPRSCPSTQADGAASGRHASRPSSIPHPAVPAGHCSKAAAQRDGAADDIAARRAHRACPPAIWACVVRGLWAP